MTPLIPFIISPTGDNGQYRPEHHNPGYRKRSEPDMGPEITRDGRRRDDVEKTGEWRRESDSGNAASAPSAANSAGFGRDRGADPLESGARFNYHTGHKGYDPGVNLLRKRGVVDGAGAVGVPAALEAEVVGVVEDTVKSFKGVVAKKVNELTSKVNSLSEIVKKLMERIMKGGRG